MTTTIERVLLISLAAVALVQFAAPYVADLTRRRGPDEPGRIIQHWATCLACQCGWACLLIAAVLAGVDYLRGEGAAAWANVAAWLPATGAAWLLAGLGRKSDTCKRCDQAMAAARAAARAAPATRPRIGDRAAPGPFRK